MQIGNNIREVERRIARAAERSGRPPDDITIIAVTKTIEPWLIQEAFEAGMRHFGESRIQEVKDKIGQLTALRPFLPGIWWVIFRPTKLV